MNWECFEEQTKLAFVGNPSDARFFLKTRVMDDKRVKVVARVSHGAAEATIPSPQRTRGRKATVKYVTSDTTHLFRLLRLLQWVMEEVVGPLKMLPTSSTKVVPRIVKPLNTLAPTDTKKKRKKQTKTNGAT